VDFKIYKGEKLVRDKVINELKKRPGLWHSMDLLAEWIIGPFYSKGQRQSIKQWLHCTSDWRIEISGEKVKTREVRCRKEKSK